jgi:uncharacterized damage-inducible protein DinB
MKTSDIIILNLEEIRRRSIKVWNSIPKESYSWKPDNDAMSVIEMVRHVLESEYWFHKIVEHRGSVVFESPWQNRPYTNVSDELDFARPFRDEFINAINSATEQDFSEVEIIRKDKGQRRKLGDYLLRIGYHESIHTGQMLSYLRTLNIERPKIWD